MLLLLVPRLVLAQGLGLDLSDEPKKEEEKKPPEPTENTPPPPLDLPPPITPVASGADAKKEKGELSDKDIASEDRVKSVQRKAFLKEKRFELTPLAFVTVNDAFFPKFGPGLRAAYFLQDSLGLGLRVLQYNRIPNDNVRLAKRQLQSRLPSVLPNYSFNLDVLWSPLYGKVSLFNAIRTFDLYLVGGGGAFLTQTSPDDGPHLSTHLGIGQRFAIFDFLALDVSLVESVYSDRPDAGTKSVIQHVLSLNGGINLYLPPSFDYKGP